MSKWRELGDVPLSAFRAELDRLNSPMRGEAEAIHAAARPHSALCLAMMWVEQKFATLSSIPTSFHNPLSLAKPDGTPADGDDRWERYDSWAAGVAAWRERITSRTYKPSNPGVYFRTTTLEELVAVYAPPSENPTDRYIDQVRERLAAVTRESPMPSPPPLNMTKGLIPMPREEAMLATGKVENVGMNRIGPRRFKGICWHRGITGEQPFAGAVWWLQQPTTAGLTDGYVDHRDGRVARMIPLPGRDSQGDMTPWAQGPWNEAVASADAKAFRDRYQAESGMGISVWNGWLESFEITGDYGTPISEATKRTMIAITASRAHDMGVRHDQFPISPEGVTVMFAHREGCGVAYKECAGSVVWDYINSPGFVGAVRDLMESHQRGIPQPDLPPATPLPVSEKTYAKLIKPRYLSGKLAPIIKDGKTTLFMVTDQYRALRETKRLQRAKLDAAEVGPPLRAGEDASIAYVFEAEDGHLWGLSNFGTRFFLDDFERVSDVPAKA